MTLRRAVLRLSMHHTPAALIFRLSVLQPSHALGMMPKEGHNAVFYPDVLPLLRRAMDALVPVYIVSAEQSAREIMALLEHSYHGDIRALVRGAGQGDVLGYAEAVYASLAKEKRFIAVFSDAAADVTACDAVGFAAELVVRPGAAATMPEFIRDFRDVLQPHRHGAGCCG
ncbi:MAG: hypothetical protein LW855_05280 [Alphaproteobacteria bacterium]|nr:hypothetical protein [Alphaproteobacteria bacterium]